MLLELPSWIWSLSSRKSKRARRFFYPISQWFYFICAYLSFLSSFSLWNFSHNPFLKGEIQTGCGSVLRLCYCHGDGFVFSMGNIGSCANTIDRELEHRKKAPSLPNIRTLSIVLQHPVMLFASVCLCRLCLFLGILRFNLRHQVFYSMI